MIFFSAVFHIISYNIMKDGIHHLFHPVPSPSQVRPMSQVRPSSRRPMECRIICGICSNCSTLGLFRGCTCQVCQVPGRKTVLPRYSRWMVYNEKSHENGWYAEIALFLGNPHMWNPDHRISYDGQKCWAFGESSQFFIWTCRSWGGTFLSAICIGLE